MDSMRVDCQSVRIATWAELERYMQGSAGSVGRIVAPLLGAPDRCEDFARLGVAFQLTNFIRDVGVDWDLGRVYLPREDSSASVPARTTSPCGRRATASGRWSPSRSRGRARCSLAARPAIASVPARVRPGMRVACAVYGAVLDRVEANGFDVLRPRRGPAAVGVGWVAVGALRSAA